MDLERRQMLRSCRVEKGELMTRIGRRLFHEAPRAGRVVCAVATSVLSDRRTTWTTPPFVPRQLYARIATQITNATLPNRSSHQEGHRSRRRLIARKTGLAVHRPPREPHTRQLNEPQASQHGPFKRCRVPAG